MAVNIHSRYPSTSQVLQPGSYVLSVTLKGYHIKESPFNIVAGSGFFSDVLAGLPAPPPPWIPTGEGDASPRGRPTCTAALSGTRATAALSATRATAATAAPAPPPRHSSVLATPAVLFARDGAAQPRPASPRPASPRPASPRPASPRPALDGSSSSPRSPDRVLQLASAQLEAIRRRAALNGLGMPPPVEALVEALDAALGPAPLDRPSGDVPQRPGAKAVPSPLRQFEASVAAAGAQMSLARDQSRVASSVLPSARSASFGSIDRASAILLLRDIKMPPRLAASPSFGSLSVDGLNPTRSSVRVDGHAWCAELLSSRAELLSGRSHAEPYSAAKEACPNAVSGATTAAGVVPTHRALDTALSTMKTLARARSTVDPRASTSAFVSAGVRGSGGAATGRGRGRGLKAGRGEARTSPRPAWGVGYSGGGAQ